MISYIVESTNECAILNKSSFTTSFSDRLFFFTLFKCYALCDSVTGYCLKLKIYIGRDITFDKHYHIIILLLWILFLQIIYIVTINYTPTTIILHLSLQQI